MKKLARSFLTIAALMGGVFSLPSCGPHVIKVPVVEGDATPAIQAAIEEAKTYGSRPVVIEFQPGDYNLFRSGTTSHLYHVSNTTSEEENPDPVKHIGLWIKGIDNLTIDGEGARLITHGEITGFVIDSCRNVTLKNYIYTAEDPTVAEFTAQETGEDYMVVKVHPQTRYKIEDGTLSFLGDGWSWSACVAPQTYDPVKDITWRGWNPLRGLERAVELTPGVLRLEYSNPPEAVEGQTFQMRDAIRDEVCGLVQYSKDVKFEDLRIAFTGNFGIVGQMSENISFNGVIFEPEDESGRTCAGFADFVQMSGCKGRIIIENCRFSGSQDDPVNVHGTHLRVKEFVSPDELRVRYGHPQTYGFQSFLEGDEVDFIDSHTLLPVGTAKVRKAEMLSDREISLKLTTPVPEDLRSRDDLAVENVTYTPEVTIRNNYFTRVPTRGILVTTRRKVLIENNLFFKTGMSGILIADDARSWFESGMVRDVTIRGNRFIECGEPVIAISPENDRDDGPVHSGITISGNCFQLKGSLPIQARSVDGLVVEDNEIIEDQSDLEVVSARGLAERVIGERADEIIFRKIDARGDVFRIESVAGKTVISGNNANSMSVGLNHYLKYYNNVNIGWFKGEKVSLPSPLAKIDDPVEIKARVKDRFFLNYCTFGYTIPWWHWDDWEHFIDWMALNGINLPLAITGQESIWYEVWTSMGLTDSEIRSYFTGPAHLPWHRMLEIDRWGGPLPGSWLEGQAELQKKIVARERELNMRPVLPAFAGHVPPGLKRIHPEAQIDKMSDWAGFTGEYTPYFLDPMDPLFSEIQKAFLEKEAEIYGTDHIYGIDLFNELTPKSWEPDYLARVSRQTYESLSAVDPEAVWLQMTWLFYFDSKHWTQDRIKPYITSYPTDKSLLLDYFCENTEVWRQTESYYGVPFIWCYLGDFGGNTYLAGNISEVNQKIENALSNAGENLKGLGSTLEGFDCNPFMYQYVFEKAWDFGIHKDMAKYSEVIADSRSGVVDENSRKAWKILLRDIYSSPVPGQNPLMNMRPSMYRGTEPFDSKARYHYDNGKLKEVVSLLLDSKGSGAAYEFDVTNLTRQWLSNTFDSLYFDYCGAYAAKELGKMASDEKKMLRILDDMDELLATQSYFLLGKWISNARGWGADPAEADYFETNARNILTSWGDRGSYLTDYANRTISGLVSSYYKGRWELFFSFVNKAISEGGEFGDAENEKYQEEVRDFEGRWWKERVGSFPSEPVGNSLKVAGKLKNYCSILPN